MQEVVKNIFTWSSFSEPHAYDFNGHLIRHRQGNLCIDPVRPSDENLEAIVGLGVGRILITNRNHSHAANLVRLRTGTKTAIHPDDADYARSQGAENDEALRVGEQIGSLEVIGVPGKVAWVRSHFIGRRVGSSSSEMR